MEIAYSEEKRILLARTKNQSQHFNPKEVKRRKKMVKLTKRLKELFYDIISKCEISIRLSNYPCWNI